MQNETLDIEPVRGCLENVKQLLASDIYIGRGCEVYWPTHTKFLSMAEQPQSSNLERS